MVIRDDSGSSVEITFWGGYAQDPGDALQEVCRFSPCSMKLLTVHFNLPVKSCAQAVPLEDYLLHCGD